MKRRKENKDHRTAADAAAELGQLPAKEKPLSGALLKQPGSLLHG